MSIDGKAAPPAFWVRVADFLAPPLGAEVTEELRRQHRTTAAFILIGAVIFFGFGLLNAKLGNAVPAVVEHLVVVVLLVMLVPLRRGYVRLAAHTGVLATAISVGLAMWYGGGIAAAAVVFLPVLPAVGLLSIGKTGGYAGLLEALVVVAVVVTAEKLGFQPHQDLPEKLYLKRVTETGVVIIQIWALSQAFFNLKDEAFSLLSAKRDELAGLLDGMRQGVLAFGADGRVVGKYSAQAKAVFDAERLEQASIVDLLYPGVPSYDVERQNFELWLETVFSAKEDAWADVTRWAPSHCIRHEGKATEQHLKLEFRPIFESGVLSRVMLLATDETENVQLKRAVDAEKAARERMIGRMRRLAASGAYRFLEFLRSAELRLDEIARTLEQPHAMKSADVDYFFRQVHTIKGEACTFELEALESAMAVAEDVLKELRLAKRDADESAIQELTLTVAAGASAIRQARDGLVAASPIGSAILDQATVSRNDLMALRERVATLGKQVGDEAVPVMEVTARLASRPFGESVSGLGDAIARWAEQRGKRASLQVDGKEVTIAPALAEVLPGVLTHLARNAVAHGVETPEVRRRCEKREAGLIRVRCTESSEGPVVVVEDDGAGIDLEQLRRRARELDATLSNDPSELIFVDGLSTAETSDGLSGRGVGMSAVREALRGVGYEVSVQSERGRGTSFTLSPGERWSFSAQRIALPSS